MRRQAPAVGVIGTKSVNGTEFKAMGFGVSRAESSPLFLMQGAEIKKNN